MVTHRTPSIVMFLALTLAGCLGYEEINAEPEAPPPNQPPRIVTVDPADITIRLQVGKSQTFRVLVVDDPNGDPFIGYRWDVNGEVEGYGSQYKFTGTPNNIGYQKLIVTVWDCPGIGEANNYQGLNECQLEPPIKDSKVTYGWTIVVEP